MKIIIKKILFRMTVFVIVCIAMIVGTFLNPQMLYANKTVHENFTVYSNHTINISLLKELDAAKELIRQSEYYDAAYKMDICLNEGSFYNKFIRAIRPRAFAWGMANKVILDGEANYKMNYDELNGYKYNMTQLLAHEMTHCLQFHHLGVFKTNPLGNIPTWKFEGYADYIGRNNKENNNLENNIKRLLETEKTDTNNWIYFNDSTGTVIPYYKYWLMVQYSMNIKKQSYDELLKDTVSETSEYSEMMNWFNHKTRE